MFDFSNYLKDSKFFDETNKKVIEKLKDEFSGVIVDEFVGLTSKMYSIKKIGGKECNTAKGFSIATEFNKLKDVLFNKKFIRHKMKRIESKKHKFGTHEIEKNALTTKDMCYMMEFCDKKDCEEIEKDCNKKILKKDCDKKDCKKTSCY